MISSKDAKEGTRNMHYHCPYQWFHRMGQGALSMVEGRQGGREQGTPHAQWDMPWCAAEKEWRVFIYISIRIFLNWSIEMKGRVTVTQSSKAAGKTIKKRGVPTKSKSSATRPKSESTNSTVIKHLKSRATTAKEHCCSRGCEQQPREQKSSTCQGMWPSGHLI